MLSKYEIGIILGDVIMDGFTVIFDRDNSQIGFAASNWASKLNSDTTDLND